MMVGVSSASSPPVWWRRWDGMPPSADRWRSAAAEMDVRGSWLARAVAAEAPGPYRSGWRRWFVGGWLWPPFALAALQLALVATAAGEADLGRWELGSRAAQILLCVLWALPIVVARSSVVPSGGHEGPTNGIQRPEGTTER